MTSSDEEAEDGLTSNKDVEPIADGGESGGQVSPDTQLRNAPDDRRESGGGPGGHKDDDRDQRPEGPMGDAADAPAEALDELVQAALALDKPMLHNLRAIITRRHEQGLSPGEMAYLKHAISKVSLISGSVWNQVHQDVQNTHPNHGVLDSADRLAESALALLGEEYSDMVWSEGLLWHYPIAGDPMETGFFQRSDLQDIEKFLLGEYGHLPSMRSKSRRAEVAQRITSLLHQPRFFDDERNGINLLDGFVTYDANIRDVQLLPTGPAHKARSRIGVSYAPNAEAPTFTAGMARSFLDAESISAFGEFVGCGLLRVTPGHDNARHALLLIGPERGGKSTLLDIVGLLVPRYAISAVSPTSWGHDYDRSKLRGANFNLVSEVGKRAVIQGDLAKAIIGHETVKARLPYQHPFFFRPKAWHLISANSAPRTDDLDSAFRRRFIGLRLERPLRPDEMDPDYLAKVAAELPGVVAWFLRSAVTAMRRGRFTLPPGHDSVMAEMQHGDDLIGRFVVQMVERAPVTERVSTKELNAALKRFAQREGELVDDWKPTTGARQMAALVRSVYGAKQVQINGVPHYSGIRVKPGV